MPPAEADGISLFNFVYYRMGGGDLAWLVREPPFHVFPKLLDREWLCARCSSTGVLLGPTCRKFAARSKREAHATIASTSRCPNGRLGAGPVARGLQPAPR